MEFTLKDIRIQILQCRTLELTAELEAHKFIIKTGDSTPDIDFQAVIIDIKLKKLLKELDYLQNQ